MGKIVKVAIKSDVPPGGCLSVDADGLTVALFNVDGTIHAIDNNCAHQGGPLGEGFLEGKTVTCPWHGWQYDVTNGECTTGPGISVQRFNVKTEGDDVLVQLEE